MSLRYQSTCPRCGNIDTLSEEEIKKTVHCQCCYHHYEYKHSMLFTGYEEKKYFNTTDVKAVSDVKFITKPPRLKEQGRYRLKSAIRKLDGLIEDVKEISDDMDKDNVILEIDEIKWNIREGLKDLEEGI